MGAEDEYDPVVIGPGPRGSPAPVAYYGHRVVVVERRQVPAGRPSWSPSPGQGAARRRSPVGLVG